jgi:ribonuclease-3
LGLFVKKLSEQDKNLTRTLKSLLGFRPKNLDLYKLALSHASVSKESNERLEYLGDAILGAIVADFLFKKFPFKDEGFLSEMRSRIVKRDSLNTLARKIALDKLVIYKNASRKMGFKSIYGNALEALIGAIFLDRKYKTAEKFILQQLIKPHIDINETISNNQNFKSILIEWAQKEAKEISFTIVNEDGTNHDKVFISEIVLDSKAISQGHGHSKKKAEQAAAEKACLQLKLS